MRAHLGQVALPVPRLDVLPRFPGPVEEGLRDAVQDRRTVPVAQIRGQAAQAEDGAGDDRLFTAAAADAQAGFERGPGPVRVALFALDPAQVGRHGRVFLPGRLCGLGRLVQVGPGGRDVAGPQRLNGGVVVQERAQELVA